MKRYEFKTKPLTTARLQLKPLTEADFSALHALWLETAGKKNYRREDSLKVMAIMLRMDLEQKGMFWTLRQLGQEEIIGTCELNMLDLSKGYGELGCELALAYRGQGYMQEALPAVIAYAFNQLGLAYLAASIRADNLASLKLFERLGFRPRGKISQNLDKNNFCKYFLSNLKKLM